MPSQRYNWKRLWSPRGESINLADVGYLVDPEDKWGRHYNPTVVPFQAIAGVPCLILLGEPGTGKTDAMSIESAAASLEAGAVGDSVIYKNLRSHGDEDRLVRELFESDEFVAWRNAEYKLHLFLDSLDECLLRIDNVAAVLADKLVEYPVERLFIRIACRTADWPARFEDDLKALWGEKSVGAYELAPLRKKDVIEAAKANGLDPAEFLYEVDRASAAPLAIRPVTLKLLLSSYARDDWLPSTREALYYNGCLQLCEECNEDRKAAGRVGELDPEHRLVIAARIAAAMVFANRYAVWQGDSFDVPERALTVADLVGGTEVINGQAVAVTRSAIEEALSTGLFTSHGEHQLGWFHQSYSEFLAAWYIKHHKVAIPQLMSLLVHPEDPEGRLALQLNEVAAWLAGMRADVFREIITRDPEVLLRSDMAVADDGDKEALVETLLGLYETEKRIDPWPEYYSGYVYLAHQRLADQLLPFIQDHEKVFAVRVVAINIAEACEAKELQEAMVNLILDQTEDVALRSEAAQALGVIGDNASRAQLKQLIASDIENDRDDELKGSVLRALWPDQISVQELFDVLGPPRWNSPFGAYKNFILNIVASNLDTSDLLEALRWVEAHEVYDNGYYSLEGLADQIMLKAWENLDAPGVLDAFAAADLTRLKAERETAVYDSTNADDFKRRSVIKALISIALANAADENDIAFWLALGMTPIVMGKDLVWLAEQIQEAEAEDEERVFIGLARRVFNPQGPEHMTIIYELYVTNPRVEEAFADIFAPVALGSPEAEEMKAAFAQHEELRARRQRPPLDPTPGEQIIKYLDKFDEGDVNAWIQVTEYMREMPDGMHNPSPWEVDLAVLPGWEAADEGTRERITEAAASYLSVGRPDTEKWLGSDKINLTAIAGHKALCLLFQERRDAVLELSVEDWQRWAPVVLAYPVSSATGESEPHDSVLKLAYQHAPLEIISTSLALIDKDNQGPQSYLFVLSRLKVCWDDHLGAVLLEKATDKSLKPECMGQLLSELLAHDTKGAREFAASVAALPITKSKDNRARAIQAASALLAHTEDAAWSVVWPLIKAKWKFGREVFLSVAGIINQRDLLTAKLSVHELADLVIWLTRQFPQVDEDEDGEDVGMAGKVGPMGNIARLRDAALRRLQDVGTAESYAAIERIATELPELTWLKWTLQRAGDVMRRSTWSAPLPNEILTLVSNKEKRLIQNGDQLLDVVIESLKRLEVELQGETPASPDLWNEVKEGKFKPKEEEAFSDYVKRYLRRELTGNRGIIFNREVEIRRGAGRTRGGEYTDIHVDIATPSEQTGTYDILKVIIEAKGCWNRGLDTDMEEQLAKRYLKDSPCQHGLYFVGLYYCKKWDDEDYKKRDCRRRDKEEAQAYFDDQAAALSAQEGKTIRALVINTALR